MTDSRDFFRRGTKRHRRDVRGPLKSSDPNRFVSPLDRRWEYTPGTLVCENPAPRATYVCAMACQNLASPPLLHVYTAARSRPRYPHAAGYRGWHSTRSDGYDGGRGAPPTSSPAARARSGPRGRRRAPRGPDPGRRRTTRGTWPRAPSGAPGGRSAAAWPRSRYPPR